MQHSRSAFQSLNHSFKPALPRRYPDRAASAAPPWQRTSSLISVALQNRFDRDRCHSCNASLPSFTHLRLEVSRTQLIGGTMSRKKCREESAAFSVMRFLSCAAPALSRECTSPPDALFSLSLLFFQLSYALSTSCILWSRCSRYIDDSRKQHLCNSTPLSAPRHDPLSLSRQLPRSPTGATLPSSDPLAQE